MSNQYLKPTSDQQARRAARERLLEALTNWATALLWVGIFLMFLQLLWRLPQ